MKAEHMDWRTLISIGEDRPELVAALDEYFRPFAQRPFRLVDGKTLMDDFPCLHCGKPLTGTVAALMGSGFVFGIMHGEGHCAECKWPGRAHHSLKIEGVEFFNIQNVVLQYHPDFVRLRRTINQRVQ
jgi:hypothetical protein